MKVDGFVALQGGKRQRFVQTLLHFKVKLHFYILAPLAQSYFCQVFCENYLSICAQTRVAEVGRLSANEKNSFNSFIGRVFGTSLQKVIITI